MNRDDFYPIFLLQAHGGCHLSLPAASRLAVAFSSGPCPSSAVSFYGYYYNTYNTYYQGFIPSIQKFLHRIQHFLLLRSYSAVVVCDIEQHAETSSKSTSFTAATSHLAPPVMPRGLFFCFIRQLRIWLLIHDSEKILVLLQLGLPLQYSARSHTFFRRCW